MKNIFPKKIWVTIENPGTDDETILAWRDPSHIDEDGPAAEYDLNVVGEVSINTIFKAVK